MFQDFVFPSKISGNKYSNKKNRLLHHYKMFAILIWDLFGKKLKFYQGYMHLIKKKSNEKIIIIKQHLHSWFETLVNR